MIYKILLFFYILTSVKMTDLQFIKTVDRRIDFSEAGIYTIPESCSDITYRQYPATSYSSSNITFNQPMDIKFAVSSKIFMNVQFDVTINGVPTPGGRLVQQGTSGPRFMPLTSVTQVAELSLNTQTFSQKLNWYHDALMRFNNTSEEVSDNLSMCPSMFDYYQSYDDFLLYGSALNPLGGIGEAGPGIEPRGGFPYEIISGNGVDQNFAVVRFRTYENVLVSPCTWGSADTKCFTNLTTLGINYTFNPDLSRVWCRAPAAGGTITSISAIISAQPIIELATLSTKIGQVINPVQRYAYGEIQPFPQAIGTLAPGASSQTQLANITLSGIPSRIYLYLRRRDGDRTYATTDTYARINRATMLFGNRDGIFSQCSPQQLYKISKDNGYLGSYSDWYKYSGSVFCFSFDRDVPIKDLEAAGLQDNVQFQVTLDYTNIAAEAINYSLYAIVVYDGLVTINADQTVLRQRSILTRDIIAASPNAQLLPYELARTFAVASGGSFGSKLRQVSSGAQKLISKGKDIYNKGKDMYNALPPGVKDLVKQGTIAGLDMISPRIRELAKDIGPVAKDVVKAMSGEGYTENQIYKKLLMMQGAGYTGGKKLTKAQLKKMIK